MAAQNRISELEIRLAAVEKRLDALEGLSDSGVVEPQRAPEPSLDDGTLAIASTQIGRVLLIFGGAYLLRAITEFQFVPIPVGLAMGAFYAVFWLVLAYRRGRVESRRAASAFFGATATLLVLPLLVESVTRFGLLSGWQGMLALAIYTAMAMLVSARRELRSLAWLVTAGGIGTAGAILVATHEAVAAAVYLALLGLASLWMVYRTRWLGLQWLGALGAGAGVGALIAFSNSDQWAIEPRLAALAAIAVALSYLLSFVLWTHVIDNDVGFFEPVQTLLAGTIAIFAIQGASTGGQLSLIGIGLGCSALGLIAYGLALSPRSREQRRQNFYYYSTLGLALLVVGTALLMPPVRAAAAWAIIALVLAVSSGRTRWVSLSLQCTALLVLCGAASGLMPAGLHALAGDAATGWPSFVLSQAGIAFVTVACLFIPVAQSSDRWGTLAGLPQLIVLMLAVWEVGGLMVAYAAPFIARAGATEVNVAILAALRTAVLSSAAVTLALSSRFKRWPEARWLVYPVLIVVAVKLFAEDFPNGQPATLFVALAFVGGALIAVARLLRRRDPEAQGA